VNVAIAQLVNVNVHQGAFLVIVTHIYRNGSAGLGPVRFGGGYFGQQGLYC
tara:strand:- start:289 stop:441 length:153 start_codon:yes stop_codon:yes gene_type:complete